MAVYSTDQGRLCSTCNQSIKDCQCRAEKIPTGAAGEVRVHREMKGRSGKPVSIIRGLTLPKGELKQLCKTLKRACGVGGSIIGQDILIQGDQRHKILELLTATGIDASLGGG